VLKPFSDFEPSSEDCKTFKMSGVKIEGVGENLVEWGEDMWDDKALIEAYDKAVASGTKDKSGRTKRMAAASKKDWKIGDRCRAVYKEDGEEYEGSLVSVDALKGSSVVRFCGYNNEETIPIKQLMESCGQAAIDLQVEEAEYEGDEEDCGGWEVGEFCVVAYKEDGLYYEAIIENFDKESYKVRFLGYNNVQEGVLFDEIHPTRGEKSREKQKKFARGVQNDIPDLMGNLKLEDDRNLKRNKKKEKSIPGLINMETSNVPPPPPPNVAFNKDPKVNEAYQSLLMSWYLAGYNAGYLKGIQKSKKNQEGKTGE